MDRDEIIRNATDIGMLAVALERADRVLRGALALDPSDGEVTGRPSADVTPDLWHGRIEVLSAEDVSMVVSEAWEVCEHGENIYHAAAEGMVAAGWADIVHDALARREEEA